MKIERRLLTILREAVELFRMILYMKLRTFFAQHPREKSQNDFQNKLCGAMINELFGTINAEEPFCSFAVEYQALIEDELKNLPGNIPEMMIPLTDALRIQTICDYQEGIDSRHILRKAQNLGILLTDRDMPMPHTFVALIRKIGINLGLLTPTATKTTENQLRS